MAAMASPAPVRAPSAPAKGAWLALGGVVIAVGLAAGVVWLAATQQTPPPAVASGSATSTPRNPTSAAAPMCAAGRGDCNASAKDGCETDLNDSVTHCGACGQACVSGPNASAACVQGRCELRCEDGLGDCDRNPSNGCEARLRDSRKHCGRCDHDCLGGGCRGARCQPEQLATQQSYPLGIGAFGNNVYWVNVEGRDWFGSGNVFRKSLAGGEPQALFSSGLSSPKSMAADTEQQAIYVVCYSSIVRGSLPGPSAASVFASGEPDAARVALTRTTVYWTTSHLVRAQEKTGGTVRTLADSQRSCARLAVPESEPFVYWVDRGHRGSLNGHVARVSKSGGNVQVIADNLAYPLAIGVDESDVYWTNEGGGANEGSIMRAPKGGGAAEELEPGLDHPAGLELSGNVLFWTTGSEAGNVWQRSKNKSDPTCLATGQNHPYVIVAAGNAIFWANAGNRGRSDGSIMRLVR